MNSLLLMNDLPALVQFGVLLGIALLGGLLLFRRRTADGSAGHRNLSPMSRPSPAAPPPAGEAADLLTEAEIYVIYGRKNEAQKVLDVGVRQGRISTEQVIGFWSRPHVSRRL